MTFRVVNIQQMTFAFHMYKQWGATAHYIIVYCLPIAHTMSVSLSLDDLVSGRHYFDMQGQ